VSSLIFKAVTKEEPALTRTFASPPFFHECFCQYNRQGEGVKKSETGIRLAREISLKIARDTFFSSLLKKNDERIIFWSLSICESSRIIQ